MRFDRRELLDRYLAALQRVIDRHDILRTALAWEGLREPVQVVWRKARLLVEEIDVDPRQGDVGDQLRASFHAHGHRMDVRQAPLMACRVARDPGDDRWLLLWMWHHVASDHVTLDVVRAEVDAYLRGEGHRLPTPLPYRTLVARALDRRMQEADAEYFRSVLGDIDEPTAPFGLCEVLGDGSRVAQGRMPVDASLVRRVGAAARRLGVSAAAVCHAAWALVLARTSDRDDVVFGTVLLGRMQSGTGGGRILGPFINTLPVRLAVGRVAARVGVERMHAALVELIGHEQASLAAAQRCSRVPAPAPLFSSLFNYRHGERRAAPPGDRPARGAEGIEILHGEERSNYPLVLTVDQLGEELWLTAQISSATIEPARICRFMHTALAQLVDALEHRPDVSLGALDILPPEERARVVGAWNGTGGAYPHERCAHELFEAQVARTPDAIALTDGRHALSYGAVNARANRLAHYLRARGVGPGTRVALCAGRAAELWVAVLAVWKAGGAYVPLDPTTPTARLSWLLADCAPTLVLCTAAAAAALPRGASAGGGRASSAPVVRLDGEAAAAPWADYPATTPPRAGLTPGDLAYVIYTSGSTGQPKGVMLEHRGVCNLVATQDAACGLDEGSRVLQFASPSFDASVFEACMALMRGATLCLPPSGEGLAGEALTRTVAAAGVTHVLLPPIVLATLPGEAAPGASGALGAVKTMLVGGDAVSEAVVRRWRAGRRLLNAYGPTEVTVWATVHECGDEPGAPPIGGPVVNARTYVLDGAGRPAPVGVAGELHVGGAGVGRGYLNRPALTAERFVPDPFSGEPGARLYRTGDRARWRGDGRLEFLGRVDFQVKVRGFRVEPGEIEARLVEHAAVRDAVVIAREDIPGDTRLVAYWVPQPATDGAALGDEASDIAASGPGVLRAYLAERLPDYMVPAAFVRLARLPMTPSGKLDRAALPAPDGDAHAARAYEAPAGAAEEALAAVWAEVLGVERVGRR
ncbi:MAG TPA: amino acid adenylation domain-containing protein, partial [Solirubrobacteraceae bacterium]|nr:amino acid adenylation domain-containing protein [Solirubrobacteraceae bacterium]